MPFCKGCGTQINPGTRFCPNCGADAAALGQQGVYGAVPPQAPVRHGPGSIARAAQGLGIAGGLMGIIWGGVGPYITWRWPMDIQWSVYGTNLEPVLLLIIGVVLGLLGVIGGVVATRSRGVTAFLLLLAGLAGFLVGPSWVLPGALLLAAGGLAIASER